MPLNQKPVPTVLSCLLAALIILPLSSRLAEAQSVQGRIVAQDLSSGQGYTVLHVWGSHYEMGYAHGYLMAEWIDLAHQEFLVAFGAVWPQVRAKVAAWSWEPPESEEELQGLVDGVHAVIPGSGLDVLDLKAAGTFGDWAYSAACRSTSCWGQWVVAPYQTLSIRKLQFMTLPGSISQQWHHVVCAWEPDSGKPRWVNFGFPAYVTAVTAVNEFGTMASLHDWNSSSGPNYPDALPRTAACRWVLTMDLDPDPAEHLVQAFSALYPYHVATGGFLNYYVPDGGAGVIKSSKSAGFYDYRLPHVSWMGGEVISTNNSDIDGTYGISPWVGYYNTLDPDSGILATPYGLWDTGYESTDMHIVQTGYRGPDDMTFWFTGRLQSSVLDCLEFEWHTLFVDHSASVPAEDPRAAVTASVRTLPAYPNPAGGGGGSPVVRIPVELASPETAPDLRLELFSLDGRLVRTLTVTPSVQMERSDDRVRVVFNWDGSSADGAHVSQGIYFYRAVTGPGPETASGRLVWLGR